MSGEAEMPEKRTLTAEEIQTFFKRVEAAEACPICANSLWYMATDGKHRHFVPVRTPGSGETVGVNVYVMVCSRCGFLRQHFTGIVEAGDMDQERERAEET